MRGAGSRSEWIARARKAESMGYSVLVMPDHLLGTRMAIGPALVEAAGATQRIRLGSLVYDNDFRHPAVLAQEIGTIDVLTGGRFEFGIGAGWLRSEYDKAGIPFESGAVRVERMAEALAIVRGFLGTQPVTFSGKHYRISELEGSCKPVQQPHPPILIGGGGRRLLTLAAQEADIISVMPRAKRDGSGLQDADGSLDAFQEKVRIIREAAGPRFGRLELNTLVQEVIVTDDADAAAAHLSGEWHIEPTSLLASPLMLIGSAERIREKLQSLRERLEISYITVFEKNMDALAPVMEPLIGR